MMAGERFAGTKCVGVGAKTMFFGSRMVGSLVWADGESCRLGYKIARGFGLN